MNKRLISLDAFRGFTIAAMVLVNNPGDWNNLYAPLEHAAWNGWTFTDWIFPFFLFIAGVSMTFSLGRQAEQGASRPALLVRLARRAVLIFLIGVALNLIPHFDFETVRIPGVLQRIALCTLAAAPIVVYCGWRGQLAAIVALFGAYLWLMLAVPVPGGAAGVLEPGQDFGAYVDRLLLDGHLWARSRTWDPEGLVSTLPAVATQLFGVLAGRILGSRLPRMEQTVWLLLAGLQMVWLGEMLDVALIPINKSLWTPSYSIFTAGWALVLLAAFYWVLDAAPAAKVRARAERWTQPFVIYGMNALFIFAFSGLTAKMLGFITVGSQSLGQWLYAPLAALPLDPAATSLLYAIAFNCAMFAVAWGMWRRKWFVKV